MDFCATFDIIICLLLVAIFTLASLSAYGSIYYRYDVEYTTDVYEQPSKKSKVIGRIKKGNNRLQTEYEIIPEYAPTGHEWMKIPFNGGFGYVDGKGNRYRDAGRGKVVKEK